MQNDVVADAHVIYKRDRYHLGHPVEIDARHTVGKQFSDARRYRKTHR